MKHEIPVSLHIQCHRCQTCFMALSTHMNVIQGAVKQLTDTISALTTLQACMILLYLWQLSTLASAIPYFKLFSGGSCHPVQNHFTSNPCLPC
jgi:hypothetical protein